ncbi:MAG TPA: HAD family hydrolase [Bryobacteraceae bacterium]|nr:HAD family hydrolase [Bryobacteraceae bacterium]
MIEVIRPGASAARAKVAILDFDGTLSLIRSGWMDVMVPLCTEQLMALRTGEAETDLRGLVEEFVWKLTGKETIYQMMALGDAIRARGGEPLPPLAYKKMYLDRLWVKIRGRIEDLRTGAVPAERYLVPGTVPLLEELTNRGLTLYLASGTDDADVKEEAGLLGVAHFFRGRIYGAKDDLTSFSKAQLVRQILADTGQSGELPVTAEELLVFGDGFVEIEEVSKVGGVAVGVATAEPACQTIDLWKRDRLANAGASFVVPNYLHLEKLTRTVFRPTVLWENEESRAAF